jgi:hypothetical protein
MDFVMMCLLALLLPAVLAIDIVIAPFILLYMLIQYFRRGHSNFSCFPFIMTAGICFLAFVGDDD